MEKAFSQRQDRAARAIAIPIAALVASHVVFTKQFPWHVSYQFPLPYFLTVLTVMFSCWEVNVRLFRWMDSKMPFHVNPVRRIGRQMVVNGMATLFTFLLVFPLSQFVYAGYWPAASVFMTGAVVCATIATIVNGSFIGLYLVRTIYWQKDKSVAELDRQRKEEPTMNSPHLIRVEVNHSQLILQPTEIAYFYSTGGMVLLVKTDGTKMATSYQSLTQLTERLAGQYFFPLNRQILAGLGAVKEVKDDVNRKLIVSLFPPMHQHQPTEQVVVSRYRSAEFRKWLQAAAGN
ncbi:LytTR family DNA-binding domain-containing protein [Runella aurantiaca]|uniref:LytTR family transcriptional regulator n=1 Tax=Runella aurantiaca TaxID=2282308 RepID=A0A369I9Y4_9BACT|nr:LytTR family DNA-binding domain-containing protein [Runella aurantiaca]RDB04004.1 LytTR family transcriptional regulator [Runella aurantiaca]